MLTAHEFFTIALKVLARLGWALVCGLVLGVLISTSAHATLADRHNIRFFAWEVHENSPEFIVPVLPGETPAKAMVRYLAAYREHQELVGLFDGHEFPELRGSARFREISPNDFGTQALLLANTGRDYQARAQRIVRFSESNANKGLTTYVLPIAWDLGLSPEEKDLFRSRIAKSFRLLIAMGGRDIHPATYRQRNRKAIDPVLIADESEIGVIRVYIAESDGFFFGACRGGQAGAVALGYRLRQHLPDDVGAKIDHNGRPHGIELLPTAHRILFRASSGRNFEMVNTIHHQSILYKKGGPLQLAAVAPDGVVEALELKNGRGLLVQFHPELMDSDFAMRILSEVADISLIAKSHRSCDATLLSAH